MALINAADIVDAELNGNMIYTSFRKIPGQSTTQSCWFDLSMSAGYPAAQYYAAAPLTATTLSYSDNKGLYHGSNVSPYTKILRSIQLYGINASHHPSTWMLLDYLMFYSFIEDSTLDEQIMTNDVTIPRYSGSELDNVQMMAVNLGTRTGGQQFFVKYTNSEGVTGRISPTVKQSAAAAVGHIVTSHAVSIFAGQHGPFIPLAAGDKGVSKIESVTMIGEDVGVFAIVLVKPIASLSTMDATAVAEIDFFVDKHNFPIIKDDAYLNFITQPNGNISGQFITGEAKYVFI